MSGEAVKVALYTMTIVRDGDRILLVNRPGSKGFPGWIGPGGKVEYPESLTEGAAREVLEETGLTVDGLEYKGLDEYVDPDKRFRYMVFNYVAHRFEGELLKHPPEGELRWIPLDEVMDYPMQDWFRRRLPLFFEPGTFEIYEIWDAERGETLKESVKKT